MVWLEFSFLPCGGCVAMEPVLKDWHQRFKDQGLVIIDVDNGKVDSREALLWHVEEKGIPYAVLWDEEARVAEAYEMHNYPSTSLRKFK